MSRAGLVAPSTPHRGRVLNRGWLRRLAPHSASRALRKCSSVGARAEVRGWPIITRVGRIEIGDDFCLQCEPVRSHLYAGHGGHLAIGNNVAIGFGAGITACGHVAIGDHVRIGPFVLIMDTDFHDLVARDLQPEAGEVLIGDAVHIGSHVTILRGAVIGAGAVILSGSVIAGRIPAGARAGGVPARVLPTDAPAERSRPAAGAGYSGDVTEAEIIERVRHTVASTFALGGLPDLTSGPNTIATWDSLGTYRLLVDLDEEFGVSLSEDQMLEVNDLRDLSGMIFRTLERALAAGESTGTGA